MDEMNLTVFQRCLANWRDRKEEPEDKKIEYKYIGNAWPKIEEAPDPMTIRWKNLSLSSMSLKVRGCGVGLMIFLVFLPFFYTSAHMIYYVSSKYQMAGMHDFCKKHDLLVYSEKNTEETREGYNNFNSAVEHYTEELPVDDARNKAMSCYCLS